MVWYSYKMYRLIFIILNFDSVVKMCVKITRTIPSEAFDSVIGVSVKRAVFQGSCFHRCFKLALQENPFSDDVPHGFINLPDNTYIWAACSSSYWLISSLMFIENSEELS